MATVGIIALPTPDEVRDGILRTIAVGFARQGLTSPNILVGSDHYIRADAIAKRVSIATSNYSIGRADLDPLEATGDALESLCGIFGITRRDPSKSSGYITIKVATGVTIAIPAGYQCTSPAGLKYITTTLVPAAVHGDKVEVISVLSGADTAVAAAKVMTWDSASIGQLRATATVDVGAIDGGRNTDNDETLRQRLIDRLSFPAGGGNVAQVKAWAEEASAAVEKAYVYACAGGPGSVHVAVTAAGGDRALSTANVNLVDAYIRSRYPGGSVKLTTTTVAEQQLDIVVGVDLPLPLNAGGAGGGWHDSTPWPNATSGMVKVTSYVLATDTITTNAAALNGLAATTHIGIWDPDGEDPNGDAGNTDGLMREYTVLAATLNGGFYDITVTGGFGFTPTGAYISTGAIDLVTYAGEYLAQVQLLGPGEKTANTDILPRARRQLGVDVSNPSDITSRMLSALDQAHHEIADSSYLARYLTGTTSTKTTPSVPATTANPPRIFTLKHLGIMQL